MLDQQQQQPNNQPTTEAELNNREEPKITATKKYTKSQTTANY